jgi:anthranilate phosphoribosyltransferase
MIDQLVGRVSAGQHLNREEMRHAIDGMMQGDWSDRQIAIFLTALRTRGETVDEVIGAASAMRKNMTPIQSSLEGLIDTCGTGGDGSGTFNISTAAAFVVAGCGHSVAKHGNRSITSKTGSADVLLALGICIDPPISIVEQCLEKVGICFCFAPKLHPAMKHVASVRQQLKMPTIFNLLGPLCNPASAPYQLLGVGRSGIRPLLAEALTGLGTKRTVIVTGRDGLDEVTLNGPTDVLLIEGQQVSELQWEPGDFGVADSSLDSLRVENAEESANIINEVLGGSTGPHRDIVIVNSAAALWLANPELPLKACADIAAEAIDSGSAAEKLVQMREWTTTKNENL